MPDSANDATTKCGVALTIVLSILTSTVCASIGGSAEALQGETWTVMVYMAADALPELPWADDINEMEDFDHVDGLNVVALVDPYGPDNTMLLEVAEDPNRLDPTIVSEEIPYVDEADMAFSGTLYQFILTSYDMFPADRLVLVLWGHGAGWRGVCPDGYDLLTLPELGMGLKNATEDIGRTLDMVIIDSCAEGTVECMYEIREYADYLVASEKSVQADGLPYDSVLGALSADLGQSVEDFGRAVVDGFIDWAIYGSFYSATMALYDLSTMDELAARLGTLSQLGYKYDRLFGDQTRQALIDAESYDDDWAADVGDFTGRLRRADLPLEIKDSVLRFVLAYANTTVYFRTYSHLNPADGQSVENASGATIYAPAANGTDATYADLQIASTSWYEFGLVVRTDDAQAPNDLEVELTYSDSPDDEDDGWDTATLAWPGTAYPGTVFEAWVFGSYPGGIMLITTITSSEQQIDVSGVFGHLLVAASSSLDGSAVSYREIDIDFLNGTVELSVEVMRQGVPQVDGYEVALLRADGTTLFLELSDGSYHRELNVSSEVLLGGMYAIQVKDLDSGQVVGWARVVLWEPGAQLSIEVIAPSEETNDILPITMVLIIIASAASIAAFALLGRKPRKP